MTAGEGEMVRGGVVALAPPEIGVGFDLAGVPCRRVADAGEAAEILSERLQRASEGETGDPSPDEPLVYLLPSDFLAGLPEELRSRLRDRPLPLVVPFPAPEEARAAETAESYVAELLRRAIGYRVRLQ